MSPLIQSILFGRLRPALFLDQLPPGDLSVPAPRSDLEEEVPWEIVEEQLRNQPELHTILEAWQADRSDVAELQKEAHSEFAGSWLICIPEQQADRRYRWYVRLIDAELEHKRRLWRAEIDAQSEVVDRRYVREMHSRALLDLAKQAQQQQKNIAASKLEVAQSILEHLWRQLGRLWLELQLMEIGPSSVEVRWDDTGAWQTLAWKLDVSVDSLREHLRYAPAYFHHAVLGWIAEGRDDRSETYFDQGWQWAKQIEDAMPGGRGSEEAEQRRAYARVLRHLENVQWLFRLEPAFITRDFNKLKDFDYCREWVWGLRAEWIGETDMERASQRLDDFLKAHQAVRRGQQVHGLTVDSDVGYAISEAEYLLRGLDRISDSSLGTMPRAASDRTRTPVTGGQGEGAAISDFVASFRDRYITKEELLEAFQISESTYQRQKTEWGIRSFRPSKGRTFFYRADVERYLRDQMD